VRVFLWPTPRRALSEYGGLCTCWRRASSSEVAINRQREAAS
jgi:hypothetical protein